MRTVFSGAFAAVVGVSILRALIVLSTSDRTDGGLEFDTLGVPKMEDSLRPGATLDAAGVFPAVPRTPIFLFS